MSICSFHIISKACKFYLIPHMMTFVVWKQSYSRFSKQHDVLGSEIIRILGY